MQLEFEEIIDVITRMDRNHISALHDSKADAINAETKRLLAMEWIADALNGKVNKNRKVLEALSDENGGLAIKQTRKDVYVLQDHRMPW